MSAKMYSNEEIRRIVFDEDVKFIRLQFVDIFGTLKNVAITVEQLEKLWLEKLCLMVHPLRGCIVVKKRICIFGRIWLLFRFFHGGLTKER